MYKVMIINQNTEIYFSGYEQKFYKIWIDPRIYYPENHIPDELEECDKNYVESAIQKIIEKSRKYADSIHHPVTWMYDLYSNIKPGQICKSVNLSNGLDIEAKFELHIYPKFTCLGEGVLIFNFSSYENMKSQIDMILNTLKNQKLTSDEYINLLNKVM